MSRINTDYSKNIPWDASRGTHNTFTISLVDNVSAAINISSYTFYSNIKKKSSSVTVDRALTQGSGITNGGVAGTLVFTLTEAQVNLLNSELYYWEVLYDVGGLSYALIRSQFKLQYNNNASGSTSLTVPVNLGGTIVTAEITLMGAFSNSDIDGGSASSVYLASQNIDGGGA